MKIGIITCWSSLDNYGQQLQCWALQQWLCSRGHEPLLIRYRPLQRDTLWTRIMRNLTPSRIAKHLHLAGGAERRQDRQSTRWHAANNLRNPKRRFEQFRQDNLAQTETIYTSPDQLLLDPPHADAYITGSDQVWHDPLLNANISPFFLAFGDRSARRISYAASIGRDILPEERGTFAKLVAGLDAVSVREEDALRQCKEAGREDTILAADPTLLLPAAAYRRLATRPKKSSKPFVFVYSVNIYNPEEADFDAIEAFARERGLDIISTSGSGYVQAHDLCPRYPDCLPSVQEWLGLVDAAQCVVTTSFHGVVFAIKLHRPFLVVPLQGKDAKANGRLTTLLGTLGLDSRIYQFSESFAGQMDSPIDWTDVDSRLARMVESSENFLNANLK